MQSILFYSGTQSLGGEKIYPLFVIFNHLYAKPFFILSSFNHKLYYYHYYYYLFLLFY